MIPKIIHFCWLSEGPLPASVQKYIDGWSKILPDYEIRKWDFNRFPKGKSAWVDEAFDNRKFAFAADFIRCYALYTEGGIYLDSDVEVLKRFDNLLHLPYFMGLENGSGYIEAAVLGSEKGNPLFAQALDYYSNRHFVKEDGTLDMKPLPEILVDLWGSKRKLKPIGRIDDFDSTPDMLSVFPFDYFSPIHHEHRKLQSSSRTITIHHFAASWQSGWAKHRNAIKKLVGPDIYKYLIRAKRMLLRR